MPRNPDRWSTRRLLAFAVAFNLAAWALIALALSHPLPAPRPSMVDDGARPHVRSPN